MLSETGRGIRMVAWRLLEELTTNQGSKRQAVRDGCHMNRVVEEVCGREEDR